MSELLQSNLKLHKRILTAIDSSGRALGCVRLLAVSKRQPALEIRKLYALGQIAFGESYLQEALGKISELSDLPIEWHFIGPLQSNKSRLVATHFDWVQSVDSEKLLTRLAQQRPTNKPPLNILLQVNIDAEVHKRGINPKDLHQLAQQALKLDGLRLRGLMAIPAIKESTQQQLHSFHKLTELMQQIKPLSADIDTLSMGMSTDLEAAIAAGSTMVRVGTLLFGPREE